MHEGDHGILDEANNDFEAKFGNKKDHDRDHGYDHGHHDYGKKKTESEKIIKAVSAVVVIAAISAFVYFRFI